MSLFAPHLLIGQNNNSTSSETLIPPSYDTFSPPALGESYNDPVFSTSIKRLTDSQSVFGFNGERAMFSADDQYFVVAVDLPAPKRLHLFDGRTGDLIRILPDFVSDRTIVRWGHDPKILVYADGNNLMGFNVETDATTTLGTFSEPIGDATGKLCGGDGNDFDDTGEWLLLNKGAQDANGLPSEMFAYNIRTGETGPVKDMSSYLIDYCTISPSGQYIACTSFDPAAATPGVGKKWIWNRDWTNEREIGSNIGNGHMDLAYLDGTDECLVTKLSGGIWAIRFSDLEQFNVLSASGLGLIMYSAVGGSNLNHIYLAVESKGLNPDVNWSPYLGELVKVPLVTTGPGEISRLAHHRARTHDGSSHQFADQPEPWINHAGDRLFFRSNMDNYSEKGKNDLYMIELNEPISVTFSHSHDDLIVREADGEVTLTATFGEAMTSATIDIVLANGTDISGATMTQGANATEWRYVWTVPAGSDGSAIVTVAANLSGISYVGTDSLTFTIDNTAPVVTVNSGADSVDQGSTWTDAGATSDGGETVTASGTVDTATAGTYTVTYTATDMAGNTGTATREVTVLATGQVSNLPIIVDQWTFTDATTPQNSDNKGEAMSTWDPTIAGNSWANGVLTWGADYTGQYQPSSDALQGETWLGVPGGKPEQLVLTIDTKDINISQHGGYGWEFTADTGEITTGKVRSRIVWFGSNVTMRMEGTGSEWIAGILYNQNDYTSITDLELTFTWDFKNNSMSVAATGSGVLAAGGTGSISYSNSSAQDLTAVTNLRSFRTTQQGQGASYMQLDTVTIATIDNTPPEAPEISNATETTVTGTAEAGSTVTIYAADNTVIGTGTADSFGNYTITLTPPQANGASISATATDVYNNVSLKTDGTVSFTLTVEETNNVSNKLQVYPNPINDFVFVTLTNQAVKYQYKILNLSGRLIQQGFLDSNKINCSTLQSGVYILTIFSQGEGFNVKIIKD